MAMDEQIRKTLIKYFEKYRIVFWYDEKLEFRSDFDELEIQDVKKILLNNNEFTIKYQILREEPKQKFLIYQEGPKPQNKNNWLLDVLLSNVEFKSEQYVLRLAELGLGPEMEEVTKKFPEFYKDKSRREKLKNIVNQQEDTISIIKDKMLSICVKSETHNIEAILRCLLKEYANEKTDAINLIKYCKLEEHLYKQLTNKFAYHSTEPSIKDFAIKLFNYALKVDLKIELKNEEKMNHDAIIFLKDWKDRIQYAESFRKISAQVDKILGIKNIIEKYNYKSLSDIDYFTAIDNAIIPNLLQDIYKKNISKEESLKAIYKRKNKIWSGDSELSLVYNALENAVQFLSLFANDNFTINDVSDGINKYISIWYKIDQYYRKYVYYTKQMKHIGSFSNLSEDIENLYSNRYLLTVNDNWQHNIDQLQEWNFANIEMQKDFFKNNVVPLENKNNKLFIIVSDALRYEIGDEIATIIKQEDDKYSTSMHAAITSAPSYTQLGMASLLPHTELKITINENANNKSAPVFVDGISSMGKENRIKILKNYPNSKILAFKAEEIKTLSVSELKESVKECDVFFVYHNRIDYIGDKKESETRVFEETETAIKELITLIRKLVSANANNILLTADHGFIYQNKPLDESDYLSEKPEGDVLLSDRRFIIGRNLKDSSGFKKFTSAKLGLCDDYEYLFPKSINRLREKGSGSQYVHGGLSLQEIIIPILHISKKKKGCNMKVDVKINKSDKLTNNNVISSNVLSVKLEQEQPKTTDMQSRTLRIGLYNSKDELLSETKTETFASESKNTLERYRIVDLMLNTKIDEENGNEVVLKLEEKEPNTTHYKLYKSEVYTVRKTFAMDDFD